MILGIDVGFSAVKAKASNKGITFPSVVGAPLPATTFSLDSAESLALRAEGDVYVPVGETALLQSRYTSGRRDSEWVLGDEWMILFKAAVSEVAELPFARLQIVTGLPVYDWEKFSGRLRDRVEGKLQFERYGKDPQVVEVDEVLTITQPYGSLLDVALDERGSIEGNVWSGGLVAVVDLGGNTLNLLVTNELEEVGRLTLSDEFGLLHTLDGVRDDVRNDLSRFNPSTHEVAGFLAEGSFSYQGNELEIWSYAEKHLNPLIDIVLTRMDDAWPESSRFDAVLLTGGGSAAIGRYLKSRMREAYGDVRIADDPQWANTRGYFKLGRRVFR